MPDIEKVIDGLEKAKEVIEAWIPMFEQHNSPFTIDCAIKLLEEQEEEIENLKQTAQSMMEGVCLLKEQEAVEPLPQNSNGWVRTIKLWYCGACHSKISKRTSKYCPNCGKPILWKGR